MKNVEVIIGIFIFLGIWSLTKGDKIHVKGDIKIAGIFNVHMKDMKGSTGKDYWPQRCGMIDPQYGIMYVEAMLFAIDQINAESSFLYGLKLAAQIHDTCGDRRYQRNAIVDIVNFNSQGVIGPQYSDAAKTATTVFDMFGKCIISYSATSPDLEDRVKYPFFYRTVPSERKVVKLFVNIALRLKWTYVAVLSSIGNYGERLSSLFQRYANSQGICTPIDLQVTDNVRAKDIINILDNIVKNRRIKVVYLFLTDTQLKNLFQWTDGLKTRYERLNFVIGDGLGSRVHIIRGKSLANGSLTTQVAQEEVPEFRDYFLNLRPENNSRNIWFKEFWESTFDCSIKNDSSKPRVCTGKEKLSQGQGYYKSTPVLTVINAVFAFANAFRKVIEDKCYLRNKTAKYCFNNESMLQDLTNFRDILENLKNVRFEEPYRNRVFQFNHQGEYIEDYEILNWFVDTYNKHKFIRVGKWNTPRIGITKILPAVNAYNYRPSPPEKWRLDLDTEKIRWKSGGSSSPVSVCSQQCEFGQVRKYRSPTRKCCWICHSCLDNDIIKNETCYSCNLEDIPDKNRSYCRKLPVMYAGVNAALVATVSSTTGIGLACTITVITVFVKNFKTRMVRASGRELCINMLIGIAATYLAPIAFVLKPCTAVCSLQRLVIGISLTVSYTPLLLRTNRIYRIFRSAQTTVQRPSMVSPRSQIVMSLTLTAISFLIGLLSITGRESKIKSAYPKHREYILRYCALSNETVFMNLSFSTLLMIVTTWFAFKTRNFPKNYNEAKYIGFTMYTTCLVLAVFLPMFYLVDDNDGKSRIIIMCCIGGLIATINLLGFFGPKVKLIWCSNAQTADESIMMNSTMVPANTMNSRRIAVTPEASVVPELSQRVESAQRQ